MKSTETPWLNSREAAVYMKRKAKSAYRTIERYVRDGIIKPAGRNGKGYCFLPKDLDEAMIRLLEKKNIAKKKGATVQ